MLLDTMSEYLRATPSAPSLGEIPRRQGATWSFLWQTVKTEAPPPEAALLAPKTEGAVCVQQNQNARHS